MAEKDKVRVSLSYAHENLDMVRRISTGLKKRKLDAWFRKEDLGPGRWKRKIEKSYPKESILHYSSQNKIKPNLS